MANSASPMHHRHGVRENKHRIRARITCRVDCLVNLRRAKERNINGIHAERLSSLPCRPPFRLFSRVVGVRNHRKRAKFGKYILEQLNSLSRQFERKKARARKIAARLCHAFDDAQLDRVAAEGKEYGKVCHRRQCACCRTARHGKVYIASLQFGYHLPQRAGIADRRVQLKDNVFSLNVASLKQSFPKAIQERIRLGYGRHPKDAIELFRLLCPRRARPHHRTTCEREEISPPHGDPSQLLSTKQSLPARVGTTIEYLIPRRFSNAASGSERARHPD